MSQAINYRNENNQSIGTWADTHNVHHEILPFSHRKMTVRDVLKQMHANFERWPKTKATWTLDAAGLNANSVRAVDAGHIPIPYFVGCYPIDSGSYSRWTNPAYIHSHSRQVHTENPREEHLKYLAKIGRYSLRDAAEMWNRNQRNIRRYLLRRDIEWGELRQAGRIRFIRTLCTINKWADVSHYRLAKWFRMPQSTLHDWRELITEPLPEEPSIQR
jgi:hypothetical protein